jgi:aminopeptidase YwaD
MKPYHIERLALALALLAAPLATTPAFAAPPPLLPEATIAALADEIDGNRAHRDVEFFALHHRMRASKPFHAVTEHIAEELRRAGFETVEIMRFPADGKTMFGTQKSRPAWDAEFSELWDLEQRDGEWVRRERLASWEAMPLSLAQDSESGEAIADLIDVGAGTAEQDYAGKEVRGKLVLVSSQPDAVQSLAIEQFGAAGIISYAQNQKTAWWREDENLVRWGHLSSFADTKPFAFMVSLKQARAFQARLAAGEVVRLEAKVRAGRHAGEYEIATATIAGSDPRLAGQEVAFSCHLDHPRPGANDNASGCATILEVARAYANLIRDGRLARPLRTIRFIWPPEIEGSTILLNARPELARRIVAVVHMDMVGGGPETKAVFHVTRSPASLPNFVNDVAETFAEFVNAQSEAHAAGRDARYPLVAPGGGREALLAQAKEFDAGSDHVVYADSSFRIPTIYLNDWPDRYIHTTGDVPSNIDPTKLERAGFIGAASAWYVANLTARDVPDLLALLERKSLERTATMMERRAGLEPAEQRALEELHRFYESAIVDSIARLEPVTRDGRAARERFLARVDGLASGAAASRAPKGLVYVRCAEPKGPMTVFGYDYLEDHFGRERTAALALTSFEGVRGGPEEYAIEVLNFVDGRRGVQEIRDAVAAEFGPVPLGHVADYLAALATIEVIAEDPAACAAP